MPTPHKKTENMTKHLTLAERQARQTAEASLTRKKRVRIQAPGWLGEEALKLFEVTKRRLRDMEILDTADTDLLAMYADALARYQKAVGEAVEAKDVAAVQAWSRLALSYAEKLGISVSARARLARKKAEAAPVDDMESLLGEVNEFVNGDGR
jgi:phage terminase small subunit